jgi:acetoin utilization deacetylase AcuC-like enzyme
MWEWVPRSSLGAESIAEIQTPVYRSTADQDWGFCLLNDVKNEKLMNQKS